jgi:hypothetical protein
MNYFLLNVLHLLAAIFFAGTVFFEVLILERIRGDVSRDAAREVESAVGRRARQLMPLVIGILYFAGIGLAWNYRDLLARPLASGFATLLSLKILLALSVLGHFVTAVTLGRQGRLTSRRARFVHYSVFAHVVAIVVLAKAMFHAPW